MTNPTTIEILGALFFGLAVIHTFLTGPILKASHNHSKDSFQYHLYHLLGEIEVVFALWGALFMLCFVGIDGWDQAIAYFEGLHFIEPFFVFAIMVLCSTRPILSMARTAIQTVSLALQKIFKTPAVATDLCVILILGPLSGSFITEPAAMTVTALLLNSMLNKNSPCLLYALLGVLFVNVSIGGAMTPFAAPPILMVAQKWQWDFQFIMTHFGWKSAIAVCVNAMGFLLIFKKDLTSGVFTLREVTLRLAGGHKAIPTSVNIVHLIFLVAIVATGHYQNAFLGIFLLFLAVASVTRRYQDNLRIRESLLVATFLGGIIVFGAYQKWWLAPLLGQLSESALFIGSIGLTAITDNAALTYLGAQVMGLNEASRYALVAGAITGGGLTIIANAPNAAGYSILNAKFPEGLSPGKLFIAALAPTLVALVCFWFL